MAKRIDGGRSDEALARLLEKAGAGLGPAGLRELGAGGAAAPPGEDPDAWMVLVAPAPGAALRAQLRGLRQATAGAAGAATKERSARRLAALREELRRRGLAGFVVPRADEHQGEYVAPRAERLAWLTGFTGSAGFAAVLDAEAAIFVDGRYTLQAADQVDSALFAPRHLVEQPPEDWIAERLPKGGRLGYDPWLHTADGVARLRRAVEKAGGELAPCADNPLDAVWTDQPPPPIAPVVPHELRFAGRAAEDKRRALADKLAADGVDAAGLTA